MGCKLAYCAQRIRTPSSEDMDRSGQKGSPCEYLQDRVARTSSAKFFWFEARQTYHKRCEEVWQIPVPEHIPSDLCAFEKRLSIDQERWDHAWAMWIRTWYGNKSATQNITVTDPASTAQADEAYARLWQRAFHPTEKNGEYDDNIVGLYIFDDSAAAYGVVSKDVDDDIELMDAIPLFALNALMRCPDVMEGCSQSSPWDYWLCQTEEELDSEQALLVLVADGEACEDGWVLMVALNHKGQVLHMRRRCKAYDTALRVTFGGMAVSIWIWEIVQMKLTTWTGTNQAMAGTMTHHACANGQLSQYQYYDYSSRSLRRHCHCSIIRPRPNPQKSRLSLTIRYANRPIHHRSQRAS